LIRDIIIVLAQLAKLKLITVLSAATHQGSKVKVTECVNRNSIIILQWNGNMTSNLVRIS